MKKAIMLIICVLTAAISQVMAQPMNRMGMNTSGVQQLIIQHEDELQLTDDQKTQLIALQVEHRNQFRQYNPPMKRGSRGNFRNGRKGQRGQGQGFRGQNAQTRLERRQEVLDILTDDQTELLQTKMIAQAEKAHEFRTLRHEYIVNEAGIEGEKASQVLNILNSQSANRLEIAKQRIMNPGEGNQDLWTDHFQQMRETDDELQNILTVDEYESLRQNLGMGNRYPQSFGRGYRMRGR